MSLVSAIQEWVRGSKSFKASHLDSRNNGPRSAAGGRASSDRVAAIAQTSPLWQNIISEVEKVVQTSFKLSKDYHYQGDNLAGTRY
jgi:hypothetical protein